MRKHLERNPSDTAMRYHIILVESRIYRIVRYYKRTHKLPENFKYKAKEAAALLASLWVLKYLFYVAVDTANADQIIFQN